MLPNLILFLFFGNWHIEFAISSSAFFQVQKEKHFSIIMQSKRTFLLKFTLIDTEETCSIFILRSHPLNFDQLLNSYPIFQLGKHGSPEFIGTHVLAPLF